MTKTRPPGDERVEHFGTDAKPKRKRRQNRADQLRELVSEDELFHTADGNTFVRTIDESGRAETLELRSRGFKRLLTDRFFGAHGITPGPKEMQAAIDLLDAIAARRSSPEYRVFTRVAASDGILYLDLCRPDGQVVEISPEGWRVAPSASAPRFRRTSGMLALPVPLCANALRETVRETTLEPLRCLLPVATEGDLVLAICWMLAALKCSKSYPVLVLTGPEGSAKTTIALFERGLVDPNEAPLRPLPREGHDLFIAASNSHVLGFDNISNLPDWISDLLCCISTGGGFSTRKLWTNDEEQIFTVTRPILINGITDTVIRPDLADRSVFLNLEDFDKSGRARKSDLEILADFEAARAGILGGLLDALAAGLRIAPDTKLGDVPRMADFALWAAACEAAFWQRGTFSRSYAVNRDNAVNTVIDADPVASSIRSFMAHLGKWEGTAAILLETLTELAGTAAKTKPWPKTAAALGQKIRRAATALGKIDITFEYGRGGHAGDRSITINKTTKLARNGADAPNKHAANDADSTDGADSGNAELTVE